MLGLEATITSILKALQLISEDHAMINDFFAGMESDLTTKAHKYPLLYADYTGANIYENYITLKFKIAVVDLLQPDLSNQYSVKSNAVIVLKEIMIMLRDQYDLAVQFGIQVDPLEVFSDDFSAGSIMTLSIDIPDYYSMCTIPTN